MNQRFKFPTQTAFIGLIAAMAIGCAAMDFRLDAMKMDQSYGSQQSRVPQNKFEYFPGEPTEEYAQMVTGNPKAKYKVIAQLIVQETPQVIAPHQAEEMIIYLSKKAWEQGADAVIKVEISTTSVAGNYARTSPVVKGQAILFTE